MNLERLQTALTARYEANRDDRRVLKLLRKVRRAIDKRARAARRNEPNRKEQGQAFARHLENTIDKAIKAGRRIVALDAEWSRDGSRPITEIGLAIYQSGELTLRNIRVLPDYVPGKDHFRGKTEYLSPDDAAEVVRQVLASADIISGHSLGNDRIQFDKWRGIEVRKEGVFDTQIYAKAAVGENLSLRDLLRHFDIMPRAMHTAGNDTFFVIMAILALTGRIEECRRFGALPVDLVKDRRKQKDIAKAKARNKLLHADSPEQRARTLRESLPPSDVRVGVSYLGRRMDEWPRHVLAIDEIDQPLAPTGKQTIVRYRKPNGTSSSISLVNFAHWAIEECPESTTASG